VGVLPLAKWELFGKAGLVMWDTDVRVSSGPWSVSGSENGTDLAYGVGAAYKLGNKFALRVEWEIFDLDSTDVNMISGGVDFRF
jgi:opacity protein-like surface antigen